MQVVFKINKEQVALLSIAFGGTMWVPPEGAHVNVNQRAWLADGTIVVEGERCALQGDGLMAILKPILSLGYSVKKYVTSDQRLSWDETLDSYMHTRAAFEEVIEYCKERRMAVPARFKNGEAYRLARLGRMKQAYASCYAKEVQKALAILNVEKNLG